MSKLLGHIGLIAIGVAVAALLGLIAPTERLGGRPAPLDGVSYLVGIVAGLALARLGELGWVAMLRAAALWLAVRLHGIALAGLACLFGGVLIFY
jgi:hypothetical protein